MRHQELTNDVAAAIERDPRNGVEWLSTWPRPFPHAHHGLALPQPDVVFVAHLNGAPHLFFGELDHNSNESIAHFLNRKPQRVRAFNLSNALPALTGFTTFIMLIVIADAKDPLGRMSKLIEATKRAGASHLLAFTLLPWLLRDPSGNIWLADGTTPSRDALVAAEHRGLVSLGQLARANESVEKILEWLRGRA